MQLCGSPSMKPLACKSRSSYVHKRGRRVRRQGEREGQNRGRERGHLLLLPKPFHQDSNKTHMFTHARIHKHKSRGEFTCKVTSTYAGVPEEEVKVDVALGPPLDRSCLSTAPAPARRAAGPSISPHFQVQMSSLSPVKQRREVARRSQPTSGVARGKTRHRYRIRGGERARARGREGRDTYTEEARDNKKTRFLELLNVFLRIYKIFVVTRQEPRTTRYIHGHAPVARTIQRRCPHLARRTLKVEDEPAVVADARSSTKSFTSIPGKAPGRAADISRRTIMVQATRTLILFICVRAAMRARRRKTAKNTQ